MESNPSIIIKKQVRKKIKFHSNVDITKCSLNSFLRFYKEILTCWSKYLSFPVSLPSTIISQFLWFNKNLKEDGKCIYFRDCSKKGLNFVGQLFDFEGKLKNRTIKNEHDLLESKSFQWVQLVDALKTPYEQSIREQNTISNGLSLYNHQLIKKPKFILLVNLIKRNYITLYNILIWANYKNQPRKGFEAFFESAAIDWKDIYLLPRKTPINTK